MFKKILSLTFATVLVSASVAGCNDTEELEPTPTPSETTTQPEDVLAPNPDPSASPTIEPEEDLGEEADYDWEEYKDSDSFLGLTVGDYTLPEGYYETDFYSSEELDQLAGDVLATLSYGQEFSRGFELGTEPVIDSALAEQVFMDQMTQNGMDKLLNNLEEYNVDLAAFLPGLLYGEDLPQLSQEFAWDYDYSRLLLGYNQDGSLSDYTINQSIPVVVNIEVTASGVDGELETFYITSKTEWFYTPGLGWQIDNFYV